MVKPDLVVLEKKYFRPQKDEPMPILSRQNIFIKYRLLLTIMRDLAARSDQHPPQPDQRMA